MKKLFFSFTISQTFYFISYSVIMGFSAVYLQYRDFSNTEIGMFFAAGSICCIILQTLLGPFLDNHLEYSAKHVIVWVSYLSLAAGILLLFAKSKLLIFLCFVLIGSIMLFHSSLFNTFAMEYINVEKKLNYPLARGLGAFCYALCALFMGVVIARTSITIILPIFLIVQLLMLLGLRFLRPIDRSTSVREKQEDTEKTNLFQFLRQNPRLLFLLTSILLVYISYTSVNNFQINIIENVGGSSAQLGVSSFVASMMELPSMALFLKLSKKFSYKKLLVASCVCFFLKVFFLSFAGSVLQVYLCQMIQFFSYGIFIPSSAYFINSILPQKDKAKGQTALGIFTFGLSGLFASLLSGILLDFFSVKMLLSLESALAFLGVIGVVISLRGLKAGRLSD